MKLSAGLRLPREHGAWAMLYIPFVIGVAVAGKITWAVGLLLLAASALFVSRESLRVWWRARERKRDSGNSRTLLLIYLTLALCCGLPLILLAKLFWLIPLGLTGGALLMINGRQSADLEDRSIHSELLAIAGMTMTAPAAYYTASGKWDARAFQLWALSALFFASSVFYIKLRVLNLNPRRAGQRQKVQQHCLLYHSFLLIALMTLFLTGSLSLFALIAFAPILARAFQGLLRPVPQLNLKRAGMLELMYSLVFLIFITLTFR